MYIKCINCINCIQNTKIVDVQIQQWFLFLTYFAGDGSAMLNTESITKVALVSQGDSARFDCEFATITI